tara:strand:- start:214 stop:510 length:297 start_codon:yes stop_codon:yes gene_type:complete
MSNYKIKQLQFEKAKKLLVEIKPSTRKNKKIDVFKLGKKIASIGGVYPSGKFYGDYATYIQNEGLEVANKKRKSYRARHDGEQKKIGSPGFYSWYILW